MIRFVSILAMVVVFLGINIVVAGEFYQYTDKNGNLVFTDDMSQVPEDQQPRVTTHDDGVLDSYSSPEPADDSSMENYPASDLPEDLTEAKEAQTDDISDAVPEDLEPDVIEPDLIEPDVREKDEAPGITSKAPDKDLTPAQLDAKKAELTDKLDRLRTEKEKLSRKSPETMRSDQLNTYEEQVQALNSKIREIKVELNKFQQEVQGFNQRIKRMQLKKREQQQLNE